MVRHYKRKREVHYDPTNMETAVKAVKDKRLSLRKAAQKYKSLPWLIMLKVHILEIRWPARNSGELLAEWVDQVADWGWPIGLVTLQLMVKNILEKNGIVAKRLKNYTPGEGWMRNFVKRNNISRRAASNIKRARVKVDKV